MLKRKMHKQLSPSVDDLVRAVAFYCMLVTWDRKNNDIC